MSYPRIASHKDLESFREHLQRMHPDMEVHAEPLGADSPLARPFEHRGRTLRERSRRQVLRPPPRVAPEGQP